jgi:hypothetical protein
MRPLDQLNEAERTALAQILVTVYAWEERQSYKYHLQGMDDFSSLSPAEQEQMTLQKSLYDEYKGKLDGLAQQIVPILAKELLYMTLEAK